MLNLLLSSPLTPPSLDDFIGIGLLQGISNFLSFLFTFLGNILEAMSNFYTTLLEINSYVIELGDSAQSGITGGLPILESVGLYRYLMGDPVFYMTYILVVIGCAFTIFKLVLLILVGYEKFKKLIDKDAKTPAAILTMLKKLFT